MARARKFALELPESSYADSVLWLQQKLGHASLTLTDDEPVKLPRPPERWLRITDHSHLGIDLHGVDEDKIDVAELTIATLLHDGRCYVGCVERQHAACIIVRLWGGTAIRISH